MEKCPECGNIWPCSTCGDTSDLSHLQPAREQVALAKRWAWTGHLLRRSLAADGKLIACERTEEIIRMIDDLVLALKETAVH